MSAANSEAPLCIIAVMGLTGVGKSTFISLCTNEHVKIGHDLEVCTQKVVYQCPYSDSVKFYLVDTPGFDDTYRSDTDVLREIAAWLTDSYSNQVKLKGIIYLYRIMDERMQGSVKRNLFMFKKLCGPKPLNNVNLATTTWSSVNPARPWDVITGAGDRHEEVVKLLLKKDTDLKSRDNMGRTPLRADVIAKNRDGWTPLHLAAYNRHEAVVRLLLEQHKANANARDWLAAKKGHGVVRPLLEQCRALAGLEKALGPDHTLTLDTVNNLGVLYTEKYRLADVNAKKSDGWTALHLAAKNGHEMELEYKGRRYGETPLLWAARNGHEVVVKLLLEKGAELESKSSNGQPLSYIAALQTLEGHSNRVRTLINNGVARSTTSHWTIWRAEFGGLQVLSYLIRQTGSLSLKSLLTLGTFFASPVLADTPGSGSSDRNWQNISSLIKHMDQLSSYRIKLPFPGFIGTPSSSTFGSVCLIYCSVALVCHRFHKDDRYQNHFLIAGMFCGLLITMASKNEAGWWGPFLVYVPGCVTITLAISVVLHRAIAMGQARPSEKTGSRLARQ